MLSILNNFSGINNIFIYFSCEILLVLGVMVNLFMFFTNKKNSRTASTILTPLILSLNVLILFGICIRNFLNYIGLNSSLQINYFEPENRVFVLKLLINLFMMFFVLINSKNIYKFRFKVPLINSFVLLSALAGCLITGAQNYFIIYLLVETVLILTYKYGSNMRIKKKSVFSPDFIILNATSTIIFLISYFMSFDISKPSQVSIVQVCMTLAILMKIGIFPIYNFLITKPSVLNIPFSNLVFCYVPWIGIIALNKMSAVIIPSDEIYQISMLVFILISLTTFALYASKHRYLIKFLANFSYFLNGICVLSIIYFQTDFSCVWLSSMFAFSMLSLYSLLNIVNLNYSLKRTYIANLRGIFLNNRLFAFLFSSVLILMTALVPGGIMKELFKILKNIYVYDKTGLFVICSVVLLLVLVLFNCLKIIQTIYTLDLKNIMPEFTKRATLYYVTPVVTLIILILKTFL